jgi:excisionase family DNA binding protein
VDNMELLTVDETAAYLKISRGTVWTWCRTGQLPAIKVGRQWRIRWDELQQMLGGNPGCLEASDAANGRRARPPTTGT